MQEEKEPLYLIELSKHPILQQLQLEEALLRCGKEDFVLINRGSAPAVVMGISGKPEKLVHTEQLRALSIPLIKRYSGGGTVVVDDETLFVSFIFNARSHPFDPYPQPIMRWSEELYKPVIPGLELRENDYVIGDLKIGGNAQYLKKDRWVHHTTFLWDYRDEHMDLLQLPEKRPAYRSNRVHSDFVTRLSKHLSSLDQLTNALKEELQKRYHLRPASQEQISQLLFEPHRKSTTLVEHY